MNLNEPIENDSSTERADRVASIAASIVIACLVVLVLAGTVRALMWMF